MARTASVFAAHRIDRVTWAGVGAIAGLVLETAAGADIDQARVRVERYGLPAHA